MREIARGITGDRLTRVRRGLARHLAAAACAVLTAGVAQAQCEGDCDGNGTVVINELIAAVRIALGDGEVADCTAVDSDNDGTVAINELVTAVARALGGCGGEIDEILRASARASVEPIIRIIDLGSASAGGGEAGLAALAGVARPAGSSGCQVFDCFRFGEFTGSEEVCCTGTEYSISADDCSFDDAAGNVITRSGFFALSGDAVECTGAFPVGSSFEATFSGFDVEVVDPDGNSVRRVANLTEGFDAAFGGCTLSQPDQIGFGIRGDGLRFIDGTLREIAFDGSGNVLTDTSTGVDGLEIDVFSEQESSGCRVDALLDGALTSTDFGAGAQFTAGFSDVEVSQLPDGDAVALGINGTLTTDCIGDVTVETLEPLRFAGSSDCFTGGRLRTEVEDGAAIIGYTPNGGLELDFGADESVDERLDSCQELASEECVSEENPNLCAPCDDSSPCTGDLQCYSCSFICQGEVTRCAPSDDFVTCEDGVF
jgi:hypothetical protein